MKKLTSLALCLSLAACNPAMAGKVLNAIVQASQGAQYVGSLLDSADQGADTYFARHPDPALSDEVDQALRRARAALALLDEAIAWGRNASEARDEVLRRYSELRVLLERIGILAGRGPTGGAEADAPTLEQVVLPTADDVAGVL